MSTEQAVKLFIQACEVQRDNAAKNKIVTAQKDNAKGVLLDYLIQSKQTFVSCDGKYIVLKPKINKPSLNAAFIAGCYRQFNQKITTRPIQEQEAETFGRYCTSLQTELSEHSQEISLSTSRPICALFQS